MSTYRHHLPQLRSKPFLTDGGLETTLVFHHGYDLPAFAAFDLFRRPEGYSVLRDYYLAYLHQARAHGAGFILESPTWRASRDWGEQLGYTPSELAQINRKAIAMLAELRREWQSEATPIVISGCIGPRGDGYQVGDTMTADEARRYHQEQIDTFSRTPADLVTAFTINYSAEAVGIVHAAQAAGIPAVIGFTVETDGRLPSGDPLGEAITAVDRATDGGPAYYMVNCAHPTHFNATLNTDEAWIHRIRAVRANASTKSHTELDEATELDSGDIQALADNYGELRSLLPRLNVFGGCCGTDHRHVSKIAASVLQAA
ncbi:MAG: homocysteine S-methyltransferase family protein [Desulfosarcinaceae bacterium]|jgi:S-methylmethionine-dependent homocysteine/selenocysteine methylase